MRRESKPKHNSQYVDLSEMEDGFIQDKPAAAMANNPRFSMRSQQRKDTVKPRKESVIEIGDSESLTDEEERADEVYEMDKQYALEEYIYEASSEEGDEIEN